MQVTSGFVCPFCLLFYILRHCRCTVAKCLIFGKLCLIRRNQLFTVFYIMYIINRISSAFFEERAEDLTVDRLSCIGFIVLLQKLCLQWIMSTKSRITSADEYVFFSGLFATSSTTAAISLCALVVCSAVNPLSWSGHRISYSPHQIPDGLYLFPVCVYGNVMYRLNSCRVIV